MSNNIKMDHIGVGCEGVNCNELASHGSQLGLGHSVSAHWQKHLTSHFPAQLIIKNYVLKSERHVSMVLFCITWYKCEQHLLIK
jgi:hypothetical protein